MGNATAYAAFWGMERFGEYSWVRSGEHQSIDHRQAANRVLSDIKMSQNQCHKPEKEHKK